MQAGKVPAPVRRVLLNDTFMEKRPKAQKQWIPSLILTLKGNLEQQQYDAWSGPIGGEVEQDLEGQDVPVAMKTLPPPAKGMNVSLKNVNISNGKVIADGRSRAESARTEMEGINS